MTTTDSDQLYDHLRSTARMLDEIWDAIDGIECPTCPTCELEGTIHT